MQSLSKNDLQLTLRPTLTPCALQDNLGAPGHPETLSVQKQCPTIAICVTTNNGDKDSNRDNTDMGMDNDMDRGNCNNKHRVADGIACLPLYFQKK